MAIAEKISMVATMNPAIKPVNDDAIDFPILNLKSRFSSDIKSLVVLLILLFVLINY